eukprot:1173794-Prorocentrum_minimum.AAC.1
MTQPPPLMPPIHQHPGTTAVAEATTDNAAGAGAGHDAAAGITVGSTTVTFHLNLNQSAFFSHPPRPTLFTRPSLVLTLLPFYHNYLP